MRRASPVEIREAEDGPHLHGVLIQEGRAARRRREVFAPGSVEWPSDGVGILTRHHGEPQARAVPTREADGRIALRTRANDAIREAVEGGRRFMSVEFHSLRERRTAGGIREILRALVPDVALVADPEYSQTAAEVRRSGSYRTTVRTGRPMACKCAGQGAGAGVAEIEFDAGAFDVLLREIADGTRNVSAISRGAADVVADTVTRSLILRAGREGLSVEMRALETEAARAVGELVRAGVRVYARPVVNFDASDYTVEGAVAKVARAAFDFVLVKPTPNAEGLDPVEVVTRRQDRALQDRRRRLILAGAA